MATKFVATIKPSGQSGDYTTLNGCEAGLQNDLSLDTILVFSISAASSPTITAGTAVVGVTSGATGVCVLVNAAQTQILIKTIAVAAFQSLEVVKKSTDANVNVTLSNAGDNPILQHRYDGDWSAAPDSSATIISGSTTTAVRYIGIDTSPTCRNYSAKWDTTKQVLSVANSMGLYISNVNFVRLDGLQIEVNATNANAELPLNIANIAAGGSEFWISNCIMRGAASATYSYNVLSIGDTDIVTVKVWNTILHHRGGTTGSDLGLHNSSVNLYLGNVTCYGGKYGIGMISAVAGTYYLRNVLSTNTSDKDFFFTTGPTYDVDYCASEDATADDKGAAHNRTDQTFSFIAPYATDFHLMDSDKGAKWYGTSMVEDANIPYSTDIDGETVGDRWNIGADGFPNVPEGTLETADIIIPETELPIELAGNIHVFIGLSTDTKPTDVPLNSKFTELNTGKKFIWTGETWVEDLTLIHAFSQTLFK